MSAIALGLNLLLAGLLLGALAMGYRLNQRLNALRQSQDGFAKAVSELDAAAARAEQGLADFRAATDEAADTLADRIEKARTLIAKLDRRLELKPEISPTPSLPDVSGPQDAAPQESDLERVTQRLGSLLSGARQTRSRPAAAAVASLDQHRRVSAPVVRQRPAFEDDLFAAPDEESPLVLRTAAGGRR